MFLSTLLLLIIIVFIGIYSFIILSLNKTMIQLDLFFLEFDLQLGYVILISVLLGILIAAFLEIIFFSFGRRSKDE